MASILNAYLCAVLHLSTYLSIIYFVYLRQSCVAHACLLSTVYPKMTLNSWHSCFLLPSARITDTSYYAWLYLDFFEAGSHAVSPGLKLSIQLKIALNSFAHLPVSIPQVLRLYVYHHVQLNWFILIVWMNICFVFICMWMYVCAYMLISVKLCST